MMVLRPTFFLLTLVGGLIFSPTMHAADPPAAADTPEEEIHEAVAEKIEDAKNSPNPPGQISLDDIRKFTAVLSLVKQAYVEEVDDRALMQAAIKGLLVGLDPHSEYLEAGELDQLNEDTSGSYVGLGIEVTTVDGALRVIAPIDDTPAARAGIKSGDAILRIDNVPIQAENLNDAVDMLRGPPGTDVSLSIMREGSNLPLEIKIKRETIRVASVRGRMLEPGYAYLRVSQFQAETGADLRKRIARLRKDNGKPLSGAILDLRSNPGGLLTSAVEVSDLLLDAGGIVTTKGRIREALRNAMHQALRTSGIAKGAIGHVHAHGLSTTDCDLAEALAICDVFGEKSPPVVAAKSYFGNLGAASGLIEAATSVLALQQKQLFPVLNYEQPDPSCPVNAVTDHRTPAGQCFLNLNVSPQGQASALVVQAF